MRLDLDGELRPNTFRSDVCRDVHMENTLSGIQDTMFPLVVPRELSVVTSEYVESAVFYTDGAH
jgi:hypothetical protein